MAGSWLCFGSLSSHWRMYVCVLRILHVDVVAPLCQGSALERVVEPSMSTLHTLAAIGHLAGPKGCFHRFSYDTSVSG